MGTEVRTSKQLTMTTQPYLLDVPKNRTKLDVWKERHGVAVRLIPEDTNYLSATPEYHEATVRHAGNTFTVGTGPTEEDACMEVAEKLRLPWLQSINQSDL